MRVWFKLFVALTAPIRVVSGGLVVGTGCFRCLLYVVSRYRLWHSLVLDRQCFLMYREDSRGSRRTGPYLVVHVLQHCVNITIVSWS